MKYFLILCACSVSAFNSLAQVADDIVKYSWFLPNGTSRFNGVAGSMTALGGDISALNTNPAGLGFIRKSEFTFSGNLVLSDYNNTYRGSNSSYNSSLKTNFTNFGFTIPIPRSKWTFAFSSNQIANFNRVINFQGQNNVSSITNKWLDDLTPFPFDTNTAKYGFPFGASLAFNNYLIDTSNVAPFYKTLVPYNTIGTNQSYNKIERGGMYEYALGFGGIVGTKFSIGFSLIIPYINYSRNITYKETPIVNYSGFKYLIYEENYSTYGTGVGLKIGGIYKPHQRVNLGISYHTPQTIYLTDQISTILTSNSGAYGNNLDYQNTSDGLNNYSPGQTSYTYRTPSKAQFSGSYLFGNLTDVKKLKGFVSAEVEYINFTSARYSSSDIYDGDQSNYFNDLNNVISSYYQNTINYRIGVEFAIDGWAFRGGYASYPSPYSQSVFGAGKNYVNVGFGYRGKFSYIDVTLANTFTNDVEFPYRVSSLPNTYAQINAASSNLNITWGFRF